MSKAHLDVPRRNIDFVSHSDQGGRCPDHGSQGTSLHRPYVQQWSYHRQRHGSEEPQVSELPPDPSEHPDNDQLVRGDKDEQA